MKFQQFSFGHIRIDDIEYDYDVVIDRGKVEKRKKKASKKFREAFGHTPLSMEEKIPWKCRRLVVGTGEGALPVMDQVKLDLPPKMRQPIKRQNPWNGENESWDCLTDGLLANSNWPRSSG